MAKKKHTEGKKTEERTLDGAVKDITKIDFEMRDAMEEAGMEPKTYGIWGPIWRWMKKRDERERHPVNKKKYIKLCLLTGWMGGHRFYAKRYYLGTLYLLFFWTLIPVMMAFLDFMEVYPMKEDEQGILMM